MKEEIYRAGGLALELPITGICDGICSNTPGDRYTLPARDMVSTEVETGCGAEHAGRYGHYGHL